jgi:hypothetical protein
VENHIALSDNARRMDIARRLRSERIPRAAAANLDGSFVRVHEAIGANDDVSRAGFRLHASAATRRWIFEIRSFNEAVVRPDKIHGGPIASPADDFYLVDMEPEDSGELDSIAAPVANVDVADSDIL